jgi:hypothetical protein
MSTFHPFAAKLFTAQKATFGIPVQYLYGSSNEYTVTMIQMDPNRFEVTSPETKVVLLVDESDFSPAPAIQDRLLLDTQEYRVIDLRRADPEGGIYLYAERV